MSQVKYSLRNFKSSPQYPPKILQEQCPEGKVRQVWETQVFQAAYSLEEKSEIQVLRYLENRCKVVEKVMENICIGQEIMSLR